MNIAVNSLHFNGCRHNPVKSQNLISFVFSSLRIHAKDLIVIQPHLLHSTTQNQIV